MLDTKAELKVANEASAEASRAHLSVHDAPISKGFHPDTGFATMPDHGTLKAALSSAPDARTRPCEAQSELGRWHCDARIELGRWHSEGSTEFGSGCANAAL